MAFTRVQFNDGSGYYTLPINPVSWSEDFNYPANTIEALDGGTIQQVPLFDSRVRTMTWKNIKQKEPYLTMINRLRGFRGIGAMKMKLNRIDYDSAVEHDIKVINVITHVRDGTGPYSATYKMIWEEIILEYVRVKV